MTVTGGCRCGEVCYEMVIDELPLSCACHCLDCQTWSGSAFIFRKMVPEEAWNERGEAVRLQLQEGTGAMASEHIGCASCLTRIANTNSAILGLAVLKRGTLDRSKEVLRTSG